MSGMHVIPRYNILESYRPGIERDAFKLSSVVSHFASGHTWAATGMGASTNLNDTTTMGGLSGRTAKMVSNGSTSPQHIQLTGAPTANLGAGYSARIWLYSANMKLFSNFKVRCAASGALDTNYIEWTLCNSTTMLLANSQLPMPASVFTPIMLTMADATITGSPNRAAITDWRISCSDGGSVGTMQVAGIDVVHLGLDAFPNGAVTLTFDDGYVSQYTMAVRQMSDYGYVGTFLPICDVIGTGGSWMSLSNLQNIQDSYRHEVGVHAYTTSNHNGYGNLTSAQALSDMRSAYAWHASNGLGHENFAYPGGHFTPFDKEVRKLFALARTTGPSGFLRHESTPPQDRHRLRSLTQVGGVGGVSVASITGVGGYLDKVAAEKSWLILTFHNITSGAASSSIDCSSADLTTLLSGIYSRNIDVVPMGTMQRALFMAH